MYLTKLDNEFKPSGVTQTASTYHSRQTGSLTLDEGADWIIYGDVEPDLNPAGSADDFVQPSNSDPTTTIGTIYPRNFSVGLDVQLRNSLGMNVQTVIADQLKLVDTPLGVVRIAATPSATGVQSGIIRCNWPKVDAYIDANSPNHPQVPSIDLFPEFEHVFQEARDAREPLPRVAALESARELTLLLAQLSPLLFDSFFFTGTIWFTLESRSRKHVTIMCKDDGGIMVLSNTTLDPLHQDEGHFEDVRDLADNDVQLREALSVLELEIAN